MRALSVLLGGLIWFVSGGAQAAEGEWDYVYKDAWMWAPSQVTADTGSVGYQLRFWPYKDQLYIASYDSNNARQFEYLGFVYPGQPPNMYATYFTVADSTTGEVIQGATRMNYIQDGRITVVEFESALNNEWDAVTLVYDDKKLVAVSDYRESASLNNRSRPRTERASFNHSHRRASSTSRGVRTAFWTDDFVYRAMTDGYMAVGFWKKLSNGMRKVMNTAREVARDISRAPTFKIVLVAGAYTLMAVTAVSCGYAIAQSGGLASVAVAVPCTEMLASIAVAAATAEDARRDGAKMAQEREHIRKSSYLECGPACEPSPCTTCP